MDVFDYLSDEELRRIAFADRFKLLHCMPEQRIVFLDKWMKELLRLSLSMPTRRVGSTLFFRSLVRNDYKELFHEIIEAAALPEPIIVEDYIVPHGVFNREVPRLLAKLGPLSNKLGFDEPIIATACALRLIQYGIIVDALNSYEFDTLVSFADMQPVEHMATIYFKAIGKATVTLQHGLYIDYGDIDTVNVINYKHQPSETFLAWGQHTAALIKQYHPDTQVEICGKPNLSRLAPQSEYAGDPDGEIVVIMDQEVFKTHNIAMLRLIYAYAARTDKVVHVRFHPQNNRAFYKSLFSDIIEGSTLSSAFVVVGHTSSLLFEAAAIGLPVVQYVSDTPTIPIAPERRFTNTATLETAMANARKANSEYHSVELIAAIGHEARARYAKALTNKKPCSAATPSDLGPAMSTAKLAGTAAQAQCFETQLAMERQRVDLLKAHACLLQDAYEATRPEK